MWLPLGSREEPTLHQGDSGQGISNPAYDFFLAFRLAFVWATKSEAELHAVRGLRLLQVQNLAAAELNPSSAEGEYDLAIVQSVSGFANQALGTLEVGVKKLPHDARHYREYAALETRRAESGDGVAETRAYEALHKALSLDNGLVRSHFLLGWLELKNNHIGPAVSELETAAKLDPQDSNVHLTLSRAYAPPGAKDKAAKELATYTTFAQGELQAGRGRVPVAFRRW